MLKRIILLAFISFLPFALFAAECPSVKDFRMNNTIPAGTYWTLTDEAIHAGWEIITPHHIFIGEEYNTLNSKPGDNRTQFPTDIMMTVYLNRTKDMHVIQCFYQLPYDSTAEIDYVGTNQVAFHKLDYKTFRLTPRYVDKDEQGHPIQATIDTFTCDTATTNDTDKCSWEWNPSP